MWKTNFATVKFYALLHVIIVKNATIVGRHESCKALLYIILYITNSWNGEYQTCICLLYEDFMHCQFLLYILYNKYKLLFSWKQYRRISSEIFITYVSIRGNFCIINYLSYYYLLKLYYNMYHVYLNYMKEKKVFRYKKIARKNFHTIYYYTLTWITSIIPYLIND